MKAIPPFTWVSALVFDVLQENFKSGTANRAQEKPLDQVIRSCLPLNCEPGSFQKSGSGLAFGVLRWSEDSTAGTYRIGFASELDKKVLKALDFKRCALRLANKRRICSSRK